MVESGRETTELPIKPATTGIILARGAKAIPAPVANRFHGSTQYGSIGEYGTAFAHSDVMRRIKAQRSDITEGADELAVVARTERIATIFDHEQVMALGDLHDETQVKWVAERMRQHDRSGLVGDGFFQP